jgi:signal transduction histidine kinase
MRESGRASVKRRRPSDSAPPAAAAAGTVREAAPTDPINILIVDDEPINLTVLETVLENPGYRLVRAESADQALLALMAQEFALLILDIRMPSMTGLELAQLIKQRKKTEHIPIIFLTAYYNEDQHVLEGYSSGAVDYLHKPINAPVLRSKVAIFANLYRQARELERMNQRLTDESTERLAAQRRLQELNRTLEQRVKSRTRELLERTEVLEAAQQQLRAAEQTLREADQRKDQFLATLAHELRNPLAPIRNAVQILRAQAAPDTPSRDLQEIIDRQIGQMARLVDDLLDINRISRGKLELRTAPVTLEQVIQGAVETSRPLIDLHQHRLEVSLPEEPLVLDGDLTRLSQVFANLLNNAAKFTQGPGTIQLSAERIGHEVMVSIIDSGVGIPTSQMANIFELFSQGGVEKGSTGGGLGIGLSLVKQLVELHHGRVTARSEGTGRGSEFRVYLPLASEQQLPAASQPSAQKRDSAAAPLRILVVDDSEDAAHTLATLLEISGYEMHIAHDGEQALAVAESCRPDVVLLDIGMPKLNGYEVCRRFRELDWGRRMIVIALTGWGQDQDRQRTADAGFNHHLVKPADPAALLQMLSGLQA